MFGAVLAASVLCLFLPGAQAQEMKKEQTGLYRDIFDQQIYYEGTNLLRLDRMYRLLFKKKLRALGVNVYDEVPDSEFFVNRHGRERLSAEALENGYKETDGPSGALTVFQGKSQGQSPGLFVRDAKGDAYLLKFDSFDNLELMTSAEVIGSRFYHAIGYHVPQYTILTFDPSQLKVAEDAKTVDDTGFEKPFTAEKLEEFLLFLPRDENGNYRASASKLLKGEKKGNWFFDGRREANPDDKIDHERLRPVRALGVFAAWLGNYDTRASNTLDYLITDENGKQVVRHYLIDFSAALGGHNTGPKAPMFLHEHMIDYGETAKAFVTLGLWEKPWQKRWREAGEKVSDSPAIGYFDNRYFDPARMKTQLPYYAFKDVTRADGFWAAKIIKSFSDDDIKTVVKAGKYTRPEDADYIARILSERRDIMARYWYEQANPLDDFEYAGGTLSFKDLAVDAGFVSADASVYHFDILRNVGKKGKILASLDSAQTSLTVDPAWFEGNSTLNIFIRTSRKGAEKQSPYVLVELKLSGIAGVTHED
jgi:hypothetical protein